MGDSDAELTERISVPASAYPAPYVEPERGEWRDHDGAESAEAEPHGAAGSFPQRHWRPMLNRWLLTLNPGRTPDEYEKAVRYFFETPGVPQQLSDVTADLLLAYRGSLALRADRRRSRPRRATMQRRDALWSGGSTLGALPSGPQATSGGADGGAESRTAGAASAVPASLRQGPLSPATANIRLTALRQFLLFASEHEALPPALTAERVRSALRRLRNDRRRPYQILAEEEWGEFLQAALGASGQTASAPRPSQPAESVIPTSPPPTAAPAQRGPWGVPRAAREQQRRAAEAAPAPVPAAPDGLDPDANDDSESAAPAGRDHRTGARTAQRDHALISLALATGLRAIELSLLDVGDLVSERRRGRTEWWLSLPDEKTKGQRGGRTLPLAPELMATLLAYIRATGRSWDNPDHRATPLFLALARGRPPLAAQSTSRAVSLAQGAAEPHYRRLRPEQIRGVIHRVETQWQAQRRAASDDEADGGLSTGDARHISPHALRHSAAIALLLGDEASERPPASVEHVRGWLGHFDIRTTQRYLAHIESRDQRRRFAIRPQQRAVSPAPEAEMRPDQPSLFDREP